MKKSTYFLFLILNTTLLSAQDATIIYNNTVKSTVTIETDIGLGSGFFVDTDIIVTNYHVISDASYVYCYPDNSDKGYKISGYLALDENTDLALLKVEGLARTALKLSTDTVLPGQKIYVMGSPKGLPATISDGIVSGLRNIGGSKLIQITAPISPGSSGGPVLNADGLVIGVTVSQLSDGQNLNFSIPINDLKLLIDSKQNTPTPFISKTSGTVNDIDGNTYKTVKIGNQWWMSENLKTTKYQNGDPIANISDNTKWSKLTTGTYCYYDNNITNAKNYGLLYNWYAVNDNRSICPDGWHIPTDAEWTTLTNYLGSTYVDSYVISCDELKEIGITHWKSPNTGDNNNNYKFSALPGGIRYPTGIFSTLGYHGCWWTSSPLDLYGNSNAWHRGLSYENTEVMCGDMNKHCGLSIRCVKDE